MELAVSDNSLSKNSVVNRWPYCKPAVRIFSRQYFQSGNRRTSFVIRFSNQISFRGPSRSPDELAKPRSAEQCRAMDGSARPRRGLLRPGVLGFLRKKTTKFRPPITKPNQFPGLIHSWQQFSSCDHFFIKLNGKFHIPSRGKHWPDTNGTHLSSRLELKSRINVESIACSRTAVFQPNNIVSHKNRTFRLFSDPKFSRSKLDTGFDVVVRNKRTNTLIEI